MRSAGSYAMCIPRRFFLKMAGGLLSMASIPSTLYGIFVNSLPVRTVEKTKFRFNADRGLIEWEGGEREEYRLVVDGKVKEPKRFSYADICSLPRVEQVSDLHCVEGWSVKDLKWGGFRFKSILDRIKPNQEATHVLFHSFGITGSSPAGQSHYVESFPIGELIDPEREILLALTLDHKPLPEDYGSPLRLIAPYSLGYKSIKFLSRIELVKGERPGWWTLANPVYTIEARVPAKRLRTKNR